MKHRYWIFALMIFLVAGCSKTPDYKPEKVLTPEKQAKLMQAVIRYLAKLPEKASLETRFEKQFDSYYEDQIDKHHLDLFHSNQESGDAYLLISRQAQSIHQKRVATGIHLRMAVDTISFYHEVFRTWKMEESELQQKGLLLFDTMVKGGDLTPYLPANSGKEEYIEFPDANTWYDTIGRKWVSKLFDPESSYNK